MAPHPPDRLSLYPEAPPLRNLTAESELRRRFEQAWEARATRDYERLYAMIDPLDAPKIPLRAFVESEKMMEYYAYEMLWVEVIGDQGRVRVAYRNKPSDPSLTKLAPRNIAITEYWIRRDNEWYRDLKRLEHMFQDASDETMVCLHRSPDISVCIQAAFTGTSCNCSAAGKRRGPKTGASATSCPARPHLFSVRQRAPSIRNVEVRSRPS